MYLFLFLMLPNIPLSLGNLVTSSPSAPAIVWFDNLDQAMERAQKDQKKILLVFSGSDWCRPCIQLKEQILKQEDFEQFAKEHLILLNIDFPRKKKNQPDSRQLKHNEQVAEVYNPSGLFPQLLLLDAEGGIIKQLESTYTNAQDLIRELEK